MCIVLFSVIYLKLAKTVRIFHNNQDVVNDQY